MSFGERLRGLRRDLDLSQSELGQRAGCSVNTIRKFESDERRPSRELATRLAEVFELPPRERAEFVRLARGIQPSTRPTLPLQMTRLIGREPDVARVAEILNSEVRLLTLVGPPGVGKTRLAIQAVTELQEVFRDGVAFVALAPVGDPELVVEEIARALGVKGVAARPLEQTLVEHLRQRHLLLLLDNFEQVIAARDRLPGLLSAAPRLKVLVTSRQPLSLYGEQVYSVPILGLPSPGTGRRGRVGPRSPSETLFFERSRAVRPNFASGPEDQPIVASICVRLEGLPLAIELAAARAKTMSPRTLLEQLGRRLDLLDATRSLRDLSPRQRSVRGALDWSFDLLDEHERRLFMRLSAFSGGATIEAIISVCADLDRPEAEVRQDIESLVDKSLLYVADVANMTRFEMHETIREYALERRLAQGGADADQALRLQHAIYFTRLAEQAQLGLRSSEQLAWLKHLDAEHDNLRAALSWTLENRRAELAGRLCASLPPFWQARGDFYGGRRWLSAALGLGSELSPACRAGVLNGAGVMAIIQNEYNLASEQLTEALHLYTELGDPLGTAHALSNLGWLAHDLNENDRAQALFEESLRIRRELGDTWGEAASLNNLGMMALERPDLEQARALFGQTVDLLRQVGDAVHLPLGLGNLGWVLQELGDYAGATAMFSEGLESAQHVEDARAVANNLSNLALMALYAGDYAKASDLFADSLFAFNELGDRRGIAETLEGLAGVAGVQGRPERAARLFGLAEALRESIGAPLLPADRSRYESVVSAAREQLTEDSWRRAWLEGRAQRLEETLATLLA
jgi:predicted ATPase